MGQLIAGINMTLDGFCDHTSTVADEEIHNHYTELLSNGDVIIFGRKTYELMQYWQTVVKEPTGNKAMDDFAIAIDKLPKIVFSNTLQNTGWETAKLAQGNLRDEVIALKKAEGKDILVGSRSLIVQLLNLQLIDEFQLCIQPIIAGKGLPLFENISDRIDLTLQKTKTFGCGAVIHYLRPVITC